MSPEGAILFLAAIWALTFAVGFVGGILLGVWVL